MEAGLLHKKPNWFRVLRFLIGLGWLILCGLIFLIKDVHAWLWAAWFLMLVEFGLKYAVPRGSQKVRTQDGRARIIDVTIFIAAIAILVSTLVILVITH